MKRFALVSTLVVCATLGLACKEKRIVIVTSVADDPRLRNLADVDDYSAPSDRFYDSDGMDDDYNEDGNGVEDYEDDEVILVEEEDISPDDNLSQAEAEVERPGYPSRPRGRRPRSLRWRRVGSDMAFRLLAELGGGDHDDDDDDD